MIQQHNTPSGTEIDVIDFNYVASSVLTDPPVNPFSSAGDNFRRTTFSRSQPTVFPLNPSPDSPVSGEGDSPFLTEVTTSLPYHVSSIRLPISFFACMIDDERIIGIQVRFLLSILVFLSNVCVGPAIFAACFYGSSAFRVLGAVLIGPFPILSLFWCGSLPPHYGTDVA
jgi:hypothetical protein